MPPTPPFSTKTLFLQFNKRDHTQNQGENDSGANNPVALVGLLIAALTLLVAMIPLLRCPRFRRWVSSFPIPPSVKKPPRITLPNSPPGAIICKEDSSAITSAEIPIPGPVLIHNSHSNTHFAGARPNTSPPRPIGTTRENGRVPRVGESVGPGRPEPVATQRIS